MNNLLLVGTPAAGKTTFVSIVKTGKAPSTYVETEVEKIKTWRKLEHIEILDTGGLERNDETKYSKWIDESKKICFFFDGIKFLKEIEDFYNGGEISSKILYYVVKPLKEKKMNNTRLFFIATHDDVFSTFKDDYIKVHGKDKYIKVYGDSTDMKAAIITRLNKANSEYSSLCGTNRYAFSQLFGGQHFFCINTINVEQTKKVYKEILDYKLD